MSSTTKSLPAMWPPTLLVPAMLPSALIVSCRAAEALARVTGGKLCEQVVVGADRPPPGTPFSYPPPDLPRMPSGPAPSRGRMRTRRPGW